MAEADTVLRTVSRRFPAALVRALTHRGADVRDAVWLETQYARRTRLLDRAVRATVDGDAQIHHVEWAWRWSPKLPRRMFEYHAMLAVEEHAGSPATSVTSTVVVLTRRPPPPRVGEFRTGARGRSFTGLRFRVDAIASQRVADLRRRGSELWLAFAPLACDAEEGVLLRVAEELVERVSDHDRLGDLGAMMRVFVERGLRDPGLAERVARVLPREVMMRNSIYAQGRIDGRVEGRVEGRGEGRLGALLHLLGRRLGREVSPAEVAAVQRLAATPEGTDRLGDAVLEWGGDDLARWLSTQGG